MKQLQFCEYCQHYIESKPIMFGKYFGIGKTNENCKVRIPLIGAGKENTCTEYKKHKWRVFWNRFIKTHY